MNNKNTLIVRSAVVIMGGAFFSLLACVTDAVAEDSEVKELTQPKSTIEAGVGEVTGNSWKFGQYNGLNKSGPFGIGNFDIRGGGVYDSDDASRWRVTGNNIGLENRSFTGEYKEQGQFKLNFGYDAIPVYRNNTYQTPYQGVGTSNLTLPGNWKYPTANSNNMRTLPASDYTTDFQTVNIGTIRKRFDGGISYFLNPQWEVQASYRHEDKKGTQALGAPIVASRTVILPSPVSQSTDQINASIKYMGENAFAQFAYYGSLFHNDINSVSFQNAYSVPPTFGRMSTAPDNQFHQFNLTGGYNFNPSTKLVINGSYGRNWQNENFIPSNVNGGGILGATSLNGDVETKSVNLKLTHRVDKDLNLSAAYKYDERNNHTPINQYTFVDVDALAAGVTPSVRSNTPYSKRLQQGNLDIDYSLAKGHWLKAGYEIQNIDRWCNGTWVSCVDTGTTTEHIGKLDYRGSWFDKLNSKVGYSYSYRQADNYNQDNAFWASFTSPQAQALYGQVTATGLPAWGPALPYAANNAALNQTVFPNNNSASSSVPNGASLGPQNPVDIAGMGRFNTSSRQRQKAHANFDYQVTEQLSLGLGGDFRYDNYPNSSFGLQSSRNWGGNFEGNYIFDQDTSIQVFYSYQDINSKSAGMSYGTNSNTSAGTLTGGCVPNVRAMNSTAKTDPCRDWFTNMTDNVNTVGLSAKHKGLLNGKLDINGDFVYSFAKTLIGVTGGNYQAQTGTTNNFYIPAADMPAVKSQTLQFKLDAKYAINKPSALHLTYLYQHLFSSDYVYTGMQPSGTPTGVMPTFEQAPRYSNHVIGLSYIYNF